MVDKMIKTNVYLTPEQHKALKLLYADTGQRITESVRIAIDIFLYHNPKKIKEKK